MCTTTQGEMMNKIFKRTSGSPSLEEAIDFVWQSLEFFTNKIAAPGRHPCLIRHFCLSRNKSKDTRGRPLSYKQINSCGFWSTFQQGEVLFTQTLLSKATYFRLYIFFCMCVPWELNPQPFALLTQCSTTEPQEHYVYLLYVGVLIAYTRDLQPMPLESYRQISVPILLQHTCLKLTSSLEDLD